MLVSLLWSHNKISIFVKYSIPFNLPIFWPLTSIPVTASSSLSVNVPSLSVSNSAIHALKFESGKCDESIGMSANA